MSRQKSRLIKLAIVPNTVRIPPSVIKAACQPLAGDESGQTSLGAEGGAEVRSLGKHAFRTLLAIYALLIGNCTVPADQAPTEFPVAAQPEADRPLTNVTLPPPPPTATPTPTAVESSLPAPTTSPPVSATTVGEVARIWIDPRFPGTPDVPAGYEITGDRGNAAVSLVPKEVGETTQWTYALVAPFPETRDGVSLAELRSMWVGPTPAEFGDIPLLASPETIALFSELWGEEATGQVEGHPPEALLELAWSRRPAWAIIPFEQLEPRWKVLEVDGASPVRRDSDGSTYPLIVRFGLDGEPETIERLTLEYGPSSAQPFVPPSNRDPHKLTTLALTGVTALVRATAWTMEQIGIEYPAQDIGEWLRTADITHISNEVPFAENCPFPNPSQEGMVFCSDPRYIGLLETIGTDIVELSGDHFQDYGAEAMMYTLGLYQEREWAVYGGGATDSEGRMPVFLEHNGNRLAFIGCNGKGASFARAGPERPGAVPCDMPWLQGEVSELARQGYEVIVTFQHQEHYAYNVPEEMKEDFRLMADAGAVIVSGSQAHQPHGMEFLDGHFIHFGLGNLFFDQYGISEATREGFVDRHIFYNGRHISTELLTYIFADYARPRPMTTSERESFLRKIFAASGW